MSPRTKLLSLSLAAALALLAWLPPAASALRCCTFSVHTTYYSDASHTTIVGSCFVNQFCTSTNFCTGHTSAFSTTNSTCCPNCTE